jgi:hypothetical protein
VKPGINRASLKWSADGVKFEHRYASINDVHMHFLLAGDGRKPVLLIHGFPGDRRNWKLLMGKPVNQGYSAVAPDFRRRRVFGVKGRLRQENNRAGYARAHE